MNEDNDTPRCERCDGGGICRIVEGDNEWQDICDCEAGDRFKSQFPRHSAEVERKARLAQRDAYNYRP